MTADRVPATQAGWDPKMTELQPSWESILSMPFGQAKSVHDAHQALLTGDRLAANIAIPYHVVRGHPQIQQGLAKQESIVAYLRQQVEAGSMGSVEVANILEAMPQAVSFSRILPQASGTYLYRRGLLVETVYRFPSGQNVRLFSRVSKNAKESGQIARQQLFYDGLVRYLHERLPNGTPLSAVLNSVKTQRHLHQEKGVLEDILIDGEDGQAHARKLSDNDRMDFIEKVCGLDILVGYFAEEFLRTDEGEKLSYGSGLRGKINRALGRPLTPEVDSVVQVYERILIPQDAELRRSLIDAGIIGSDRRVRHPEKLLRRYQHAQEREFVDFLVGKDTPGQSFYTNLDSTGFNIMVSGGKITPIDFEQYGFGSIFTALAPRLVTMSKKGSSVDEKVSFYSDMADRLYSAYEACFAVSPREEKITPEEFKAGLHRAILAHHLVLARRFHQYARHDHDPEKIELLARANYAMFEQLALKREVSLPAIAYVRSLFGQSSYGDISAFGQYDAVSNSELQPRDMEELLAHELDQMASQARSHRIAEARRRTLLPAGIAAALLLATAASYMAVRNQYEVEHQRKVTELERASGLVAGIRGNRNLPDITFIARQGMVEWEWGITDKKTALGLSMTQESYAVVKDAIETTGSTEWMDISMYVFRHNRDVFAAVEDAYFILDTGMISGIHNDNVAKKTFKEWEARRIAQNRGALGAPTDSRERLYFPSTHSLLQ
ncbi:MAG: hypothetical protein V1735_02675 [Nanoarchaeota archaeon]